MRIPISFLVGLYNEERRIGWVLDHALRWADEVVVINKSSTDGTAAICRARGAGVKVVDVPYSPQGQGDLKFALSRTANDWVFVGTCSETPTRGLIDEVRRVLDETNGELDLLYIPKKLYSFGIHSRHSPWYVPHHPFVVNKHRVVITDRIHQHLLPSNPENTRFIPYSEDCCVYHLTHPTAKRLVQVMAQYWEAEVADCDDPAAAVEDCFFKLSKNTEDIMKMGPDGVGIYAAWSMYWLGKVLFIWEKERAIDVPAFYRELTENLLLRQWTARSSAGETPLAIPEPRPEAAEPASRARELGDLKSLLEPSRAEVRQLEANMEAKAAEIAKLKEKSAGLLTRLKEADDAVRSAEAWQRRSWFTRAFHRWRRPPSRKVEAGAAGPP